MPQILIAEDEASLRRALRRHLEARGWEVLEAGTVAEAARLLEREPPPDALLVDYSLPDGDCFALVQARAARLRRASVVVMTGSDSLQVPIRALQAGAADFLLKPFSMDALDEALARTVQRQQLECYRPAAAGPEQRSPRAFRDRYAASLIGEDPKLLRVFSTLERIADTDCSVLIVGESGTGKELVARALHAASDRRDKPFVAVNCAAIPENLFESELFGHARGAFTGASERRVGRFMQADGGTLLLDEIGELPLPVQAKLLRVLQEREVTPVGESRAQRVDVRVVAATHRDLEQMVAEGKFREDLLYRIHVVPVELPALRERRSDVPRLVRHFIERARERRGRDVTGITEEAMAALCAYRWPGNVRQLENAVERMVLLRGEGLIELDDVPERIRNAGANGRESTPGEIAAPAHGRWVEPGRASSPGTLSAAGFGERVSDVYPVAPPATSAMPQGALAAASPLGVGALEPVLPAGGIDLRDAVDRFETALIRQALERAGWNKNRAAAMLQMNRTTLVEKLKKRGALAVGGPTGTGGPMGAGTGPAQGARLDGTTGALVGDDGDDDGVC
jgi:two-component system NtrC family response regulator